MSHLIVEHLSAFGSQALSVALIRMQPNTHGVSAKRNLTIMLCHVMS